MNPDDQEPRERISTIGSDLLSHPDFLGESVKLPLTTQLFPYLFVASRKMTTRKLSAWLEKEKGIKFSAAAVSKSLRRPELHLRRIAEFVQPPASYLAAVYDRDAESLLFDDDPISEKGSLQILAEEILTAREPSKSEEDAISLLNEHWVSIPDEVKYMCRRFFDFSDGSDEEEDGGEYEVEE
jgi:hypothetical protein